MKRYLKILKLFGRHLFVVLSICFVVFACHHKKRSSTLGGNFTYFPAGYYINTSGGTFPLLAVSTDSGNTWSYKITSTTMPSDQDATAAHQSALLVPGGCNGTLCTAAGSYINTSGGQFPLLAVSTDSGNTWSYKITSTTMPSDQDATAANQIAALSPGGCNGTLCTAAGFYKNTSGGTFPLLAVSTDSGTTWSYKITSTTMPSDQDATAANQAALLFPGGCNGTLCTAAGYYRNTSGGQFPLLAVSTDSGNTWSYKITSTTMPSDQDTTAANQSAQLFPGGCNGTLCTAAGSYINTSGGTFPLLAVSTDSGNTWSYKITSTTMPSDQNATAANQSAGLFPGGCNGTLCTAAGSYKNTSGGTFPLLAVSTDSGNTWSYKITSTTMPSDQNATAANQSAGLFPGGCNGTLCTAAGSYKNTSGGRFPLLAVSTDSGNTWSYKITSTTMPSDQDATAANQIAGLSPGGCNGTLCTAAGFYRNTSGGTFPLLAVSTDSGTTWSYKITSTTMPSDQDTTAANQVAIFCTIFDC